MPSIGPINNQGPHFHSEESFSAKKVHQALTEVATQSGDDQLIEAVRSAGIDLKSAKNLTEAKTIIQEQIAPYSTQEHTAAFQAALQPHGLGSAFGTASFPDPTTVIQQMIANLPPGPLKDYETAILNHLPPGLTTPAQLATVIEQTFVTPPGLPGITSQDAYLSFPGLTQDQIQDFYSGLAAQYPDPSMPPTLPAFTDIDSRLLAAASLAQSTGAPVFQNFINAIKSATNATPALTPQSQPDDIYSILSPFLNSASYSNATPLQQMQIQCLIEANTPGTGPGSPSFPDPTASFPSPFLQYALTANLGNIAALFPGIATIASSDMQDVANEILIPLLQGNAVIPYPAGHPFSNPNLTASDFAAKVNTLLAAAPGTDGKPTMNDVFYEYPGLEPDDLTALAKLIDPSGILVFAPPTPTPTENVFIKMRDQIEQQINHDGDPGGLLDSTLAGLLTSLVQGNSNIHPPVSPLSGPNSPTWAQDINTGFANFRAGTIALYNNSPPPEILKALNILGANLPPQ